MSGSFGIAVPADQIHASIAVKSNERELTRVYRKIAVRIVPLIFLGYVVAYLDRINVGYAKLQFTQDLQFTEAVYGFGAGLFFFGYFLFEIPSNILLERIGARLTLLRIMALWGVISGAMAFIGTPTQFYVMRFLLGVAEAGFFPGVILYLSYWFPTTVRGRMTSLFVMGGAAAGLVGAPISSFLLNLDGLHGLRGWQILFIYEAIPAIALAIVYAFTFTDRPSEATWLTDEEKKLVIDDIEVENAAKSKTESSRLRDVLGNPVVYVLVFAYMSVLAGTQAVSLWTPTILKGHHLSITAVGWYGMLPFVGAIIGMYCLGRSSDHFQERRCHFAAAMCSTGASLAALQLATSSLPLTVFLLVTAGIGSFSSLALFWTIPPAQLSEKAKAAGIAFISSFGSVGGFYSPVVVGWSTTLGGGTIYGGLAVVGLLLAICGLSITLVRREPIIAR
jgi:ACS family phthalate transporter-like MFS transporter